MAEEEQQGAGRGKKSAGRLIAERFQMDRLAAGSSPVFCCQDRGECGLSPVKGFFPFLYNHGIEVILCLK